MLGVLAAFAAGAALAVAAMLGWMFLEDARPWHHIKALFEKPQPGPWTRFYKCRECGCPVTRKAVRQNNYTCPQCGHASWDQYCDQIIVGYIGRRMPDGTIQKRSEVDE